jgi:exo-beta-1,3-glucanase (GH17 family)
VLSLVDCGQGQQVLSAAREIGMKVWLGLWVGPDEFGDVFDQEKDELERMLEAGMIDETTVLGVTVGSEAIYREDATVEEMITHLEEVKQLLNTYQINIPVSIVDIAPIYSNSVELRTAVDVIYTNTFPFWEATPIDNAVDELASDIEWLLNLPEAQGKPFVLGETGWPSEGFISGVGVASADNQRQYFIDAFCYMEQQNWDYYWFTGIDNAWRLIQDPNNTIEGSWGFLYANLTLKEHFQDLTFTCDHNGVEYSFGEIDWTIPTDFTAAPTVLNPASCSVHRSCSGLFGMCCPTEEGNFLGCCDASITASPSITPAGTDPTPTDSTDGTESPTESTTPAPQSNGDPTVEPVPTPEVAVPTSSPTVRPLVPVSVFPPSEPPATTTPSGAADVYINCLHVSRIVSALVAVSIIAYQMV